MLSSLSASRTTTRKDPGATGPWARAAVTMKAGTLSELIILARSGLRRRGVDRELRERDLDAALREGLLDALHLFALDVVPLDRRHHLELNAQHDRRVVELLHA